MVSTVNHSRKFEFMSPGWGASLSKTEDRRQSPKGGVPLVPHLGEFDEGDARSNIVTCTYAHYTFPRQCAP